mmetsp:Transcript_19462/g.42558  ORF Transcript_19462/g.42558 Transcript_19462/m.42558 type:complete len:214 (+) Transcript_19462:148-789(+)
MESASSQSRLRGAPSSISGWPVSNTDSTKPRTPLRSSSSLASRSKERPCNTRKEASRIRGKYRSCSQRSMTDSKPPVVHRARGEVRESLSRILNATRTESPLCCFTTSMTRSRPLRRTNSWCRATLSRSASRARRLSPMRRQCSGLCAWMAKADTALPRVVSAETEGSTGGAKLWCNAAVTRLMGVSGSPKSRFFALLSWSAAQSSSISVSKL